jgi:glycosyltransferase involved in cell wall biosynthesis
LIEYVKLIALIFNKTQLKIISYSMTLPSQLLFAGLGWFPTTPGGMDRYGYELMQQLVAGGDHINLCGIGLPESTTHAAITLRNLANPRDPLVQRLWSVRQRFRQQQRQMPKPHAINLHFAPYSFPLLNEFPRGVPITFTFHGPWALESQQEGEKPWSVASKRWIEQRVYRRCDRFIVLSKAFGTILHEHYKVSWDKIHVIPGGVDTKRFCSNLSREQARQSLGWPLDPFILFTSRRLVKRMGLDVLLNAFAKVKSAYPEVRLFIAGRGPQQDSLKQQVSALDLESHVEFLGYLPDELLPVAYQAADLTVMPSQSLEGFGLVLLESLACGTPVLCTPIGGMPEVLNPFFPELITESAHEGAIAERLIDFMTGKIRLPSRSECREYAANNFDWQVVAQRVRAVLLS